MILLLLVLINELDEEDDNDDTSLSDTTGRFLELAVVPEESMAAAAALATNTSRYMLCISTFLPFRGGIIEVVLVLVLASVTGPISLLLDLFLLTS